MKIGILLTQKDDSAFAAQFPDDGKKFTTLLRRQKPDWTFCVYASKDGEFPQNVDEMDGYLITGSPVSVHAGFDWIETLLGFVRDLHAAKKPLFGACFGHQAIALALDGQVGKNPAGWSLGIATTTFDNPQAWMVPPARALTLFTAHEEQVLRLPEGAYTIGHSAHCPHAGFCIDAHVATTQYYPEMPVAFMSALLIELRGRLSNDVLSRAETDLNTPTDGDHMAKWITQFFAGQAG